MSKSYKQIEKAIADSINSAKNYNYNYKKDLFYIEVKDQLHSGKSKFDQNKANIAYDKFLDNLSKHRNEIKNKEQQLKRQGKLKVKSPFEEEEEEQEEEEQEYTTHKSTIEDVKMYPVEKEDVNLYKQQEEKALVLYQEKKINKKG